MAEYTVRTAEQQDVLNTELETKMNSGQFAQCGLVPNDGVNEIRPQDMFEEVDVPDTLVDKKGYPVRFTDGVYDRLDLIVDGHYTLNDKWNSTAGALNTNTSLNFLDMVDLIETNSANYSVILVDDSGNEIIGTYKADDNLFSLGGNFTIGNSYYVRAVNYGKSIPQFTLPKAPFAGTAGSIGISSTEYDYAFNGATHTDVLLNDKDDGITVPVGMKAGGIVVCGNELVPSLVNATEGNAYTTIDSATENEITFSVSGYSYGYVSGLGLMGTVAGVYDVSITVAGSHRILVGDFDSGVVSGTITYNEQITMDGTGTLHLEVQGDGNSVTFDNISVKLKDQSYIAIEDTTGGVDTLDGGKFKAIPYVTKQVALLIEKTSVGAILNTVKPLVNMYGEESVETYEQDIMGELGYSQVQDRAWTDGSSEFILVGLKGYVC